MEKQNPESASAWQPPRHWVGPEQLSESYWKDAQLQEKRGQEFYEKPIEWLEKVEKSANFETDRRQFLTLMGASVAMASVACARRPVHKIIPYVNKPEEVVPGVATWYASTSGDDQESAGLLIKNREGRPIKLEGNPDHPLTQGRLSAQAQAGILNLYDPARLMGPMAHGRGSESGRALGWDEVDAAILGKLKAASRVRVLTGAIGQGATTRKLVREFVSQFKDGAHVEFEPLSNDEIAQAQAESYGAAVLPHYRFDEADVIVSLGADFLGTWIAPVEFSGAWAKNRKLESAKHKEAKLSQFFCFESAFTVTGANADERYPVRPGDQIKIALALANEIFYKHRVSEHANNATLKDLMDGYAIERVAQDLKVEGLDQGLKRAAEALAKARGRGLVVAGGPGARTEDAVALQVAVNLLNSALGNEGVTVEGGRGREVPAYSAFGKLVEEMRAGGVDALIIQGQGTNPVYAAPHSGFAEALAKVPLVISIVERENETSVGGDYSLADHHYLENWGDANPRSGVLSLAQPAISPLHNTRAFQDNLIAWAKGLGATGTAAKAKDWHEYLKANWSNGSDADWEESLRKGARPGAAGGGGARPFRSSALALLPRFKAADPATMRLALYANISVGDGRHANNAWLQELPDPVSSVTWDNYAAIAPKTAERLGIKTDDVVEVKSGDTRVELPVVVQPGIHPSVLAVAVGYGRRLEGKVGRGTGVDVYPFVKPGKDGPVFSGQEISIRKTGRFYHLARTQWHTNSQERPILNDITFAEFKRSPKAANETNPELRLPSHPSMYTPHEYKGYRWGMVIDLNSCIGCNACMIACQAENNIPVVGRDGVRASRAMHWIRIDRYYAGGADNPDVVFQPMLCQHCENAPCENVCPVIATMHDDEGLNVQAYNRCVGTRYCQNNCPYKVRKFNYFDHWKSYESTMNLAWNPDVTVRTRGIMEKCTFCVQRIREARDQTTLKGIKISDATFKTACQQTCPTDAITFGDVNNPESRVSKLRKDDRGFKVLDTLNTVPMITYLTKVRNKLVSSHKLLEEKEDHAHSAEHGG